LAVPGLRLPVRSGGVFRWAAAGSRSPRGL